MDHHFHPCIITFTHGSSLSPMHHHHLHLLSLRGECESGQVCSNFHLCFGEYQLCIDLLCIHPGALCPKGGTWGCCALSFIFLSLSLSLSLSLYLFLSLIFSILNINERKKSVKLHSLGVTIFFSLSLFLSLSLYFSLSFIFFDSKH